jgi:teichuronic acid exporter
MTTKLDKRLLKAVPWTMVDGGFNLIYSIGMVVLLGWFITPSELGLASVAIAVIQITESCYGEGLQEAVVRSSSSHTSLTDSAHTTALILSLIGAIVCCIIAWPLAIAYNNNQILWLTIAASVILPFNALFSIPTAILSRKIRITVLTRRIMLAKTFAAITFVTSALLHFGAWSIVLSSIASSLGSLCMIFFSLKRWPKLRINRSEAHQILRYSMVSSASTLCWIGTIRVFALLFGFFHGISALGNFQFAQRLVDELAGLLQVTVVRVGLSYFAGLKRSAGDMSNAFLNGTRFLNTLAAPVYVGLMLVASDIGPMLFSNRWLTTIPMIWVLALSWVLVFPKILVPTVLKAHGKPSLPLIFSLFEAAVALIVTFVTAGLSPLAAVIGWGVAQISSLPLELYIMRRELGIPIGTQVRQTIPAIAAAALMAVIVWCFQQNVTELSPILSLCSSILIGTVSYGLLMSLFDPGLIPLLKTIGKKHGQISIK